MTQQEKQIRWCLVATIAIMLFNGFFWQYLPNGSYYVLNALGWLTMAIGLNRIVFKYVDEYNTKLLSEYIVFATANNFLDETIFQNIQFSYGEFVIFVFITTLYIYKYVKRTN